MEMLLHATRPLGVTSFQVLPPSSVMCINPVSEPTQTSFCASGEGAIAKTTPYPLSRASETEGGPEAFCFASRAPVKSGLILCQCSPPSVVVITYCVPRNRVFLSTGEKINIGVQGARYFRSAIEAPATAAHGVELGDDAKGTTGHGSMF